MLKPVLLANAVSCLGFGLVFLLFAQATAAFLGDPPPLLLRLLGAGLVINAGLLIHAALRARPRRIDVMFFAIGDFLWVLATAALLTLGLWVTTPTGIAAAIAVAVFVGLCGGLQWRFAPAA